MRKVYVISLLGLLVVLCSACLTTKYGFNGEQLKKIQLGMTLSEVETVLGKPVYRSVNAESEVWEFRSRGYLGDSVVRIWIVDGKVVEMQSFMDNGCEQQKEEKRRENKENRSSKKDTGSKVWTTTDGKHIVQFGSTLINSDGSHDTVVSAGNGLIITGSGKHIHAH